MMPNNNINIKSSPRKLSALAVGVVVACSSCIAQVDGFALAQKSSFMSRPQELSQTPERGSTSRSVTNSLTMYVPSPGGSGSAASISQKTSAMAASNMYDSAWLNPSDTALPSFHTSNGLLSPQTVKRIEKANTDSCGSSRNDAVGYFIETYKGFGPMACLPILSDPDVLPELTRAMRDSQL
jgi:hypothetical protein